MYNRAYIQFLFQNEVQQVLFSVNPQVFNEGTSIHIYTTISSKNAFATFTQKQQCCYHLLQ